MIICEWSSWGSFLLSGGRWHFFAGSVTKYFARSGHPLIFHICTVSGELCLLYFSDQLVKDRELMKKEMPLILVRSSCAPDNIEGRACCSVVEQMLYGQNEDRGMFFSFLYNTRTRRHSLKSGQ